MSEQERGGNSGLERLTVPEQKQFSDLRNEIIGLYNYYNVTGNFQASDGKMIMPIVRLQLFGDLLTKTGIHFEQLDTPLQVAIQFLGLTENLFPGMAIPAVAEEVFPPSKRPDGVEEDGLSTLIMTEDELRRELGILIKTVETAMNRNTIEPRHLQILCDEIVRQCQAYGGVEKYVGDRTLAEFIIAHSHEGGKRSFEQPPTPAYGTPRPETVVSTTDKGIRAAVRRLFGKK